MADLASLLSNAAQTNADFDLGKINRSYWEGQDQYVKNQLRDAFKEGVPVGPDGQPVFGAMAKTLFQKGGLGEGIATSNLDLARQGILQNREAANFSATGQPGQTAIVSPPSSNRQPQVSVAPAINSGKRPTATVMQAAAAQGIPNDQLQGVTDSITRQLGPERVGPNGEIDLNDPQVTKILVPAIAQFKKGGIGQVQPSQPGDNQPGSTAPIVPTPVPTQSIQPQQPQAPSQSGRPNFANAVAAGLIPPGVDPATYVGGMRLRAASLPKGPAQESLQARVNAIDKAQELTSAERDYSAAQANPKLTDFQNQQAAEAAQAKGTAEANVKEQNEYIDSGKAASSRLATLNAMANVVNNDKNVGLGYAGDTELKLKMMLQRLGINVGDLSGAELLQKSNAALATEMMKSFTSRGTQMEFKTFIGNNPGLLLDKAGNQRLIGIYSQLAKREIDLGKLARQNRDNWDNWDSIVEKYDTAHQITDPITKKPIYTNSIVSPGPSGTGVSPASGAAQAATMISSKADYDKLPSGAKFRGPDGKPWQKP